MKKNKAFWICIILWIVITLLRLAFHQPWYDEAHAYTLAQNNTIMELISEMKYEGHVLLWYLIIMPFAKLDLWYPYPMQIINWIFAFVAILVMWKKAPFHPVTKTVITFSYPFLAALPINARCYAIGVLLLFLIVSLYNNKTSLKHPIWYSLLLALCANTSIMAIFAVTPFGLIFAYDLIKGFIKGKVSRKDFRISFSILTVAAITVLWPLSSTTDTTVSTPYTFGENFNKFLFGYEDEPINPFTSYLYYTIFLITAIYTAVISWLKDKKVLFIWGFPIFSILGCLVFKYAGYSHHYIFLWISTLIAYWILLSTIQNNKLLNIITQTVLVVFFATLIFPGEMHNHVVYQSHSKDIYNIVKSEVPESARIINVSKLLGACLPYFNKDDKIEIWDYGQVVPAKHTSIIDHPAKNDDWYFKVSPDWFKKSMATDRKNYAILPIVNGNENNIVPLKFSSRNLTLYFIPIRKIKNHDVLYEVVENIEYGK